VKYYWYSRMIRWVQVKILNDKVSTGENVIEFDVEDWED
jgi:hypothetical protein